MPTALVTGANRGIGLELARQLAARGDNVVATARDPATATALSALIATGARIEIHALDVADDISVAALAKRLDGRPIDLIVNNAGVLNSYGSIDDPTHDRTGWSQVLMTNVAGPFFVAREFRRHLKAGNGRKLATIASSMGLRANAKGSAYAYRASKAAVYQLSASLADGLAADGIAVAAYDPGWVRTDMGGGGADIDVETCVGGLIAQFDKLTLAMSGGAYDYLGNPIPL